MTSEQNQPAGQKGLSALSALKPLMPLALRYRGRAALALLALVAAAAATLAIPFGVRSMIDGGFSGGGPAAPHFLALFAIIAVLSAASSLRYYFVMSLGERVTADLRARVFDHLTNLDAAFYDRERSAEIVSRLTADATQIKSAFGASASIALRNLIMFAGAAIMMAVTSPKLSGFVLIAIPLIVLPLVFAGRMVRDRSRAAQDRLADAAAYAAEQIGAARTMQSFGAEPRARQRFQAAAEQAYEAARASLAARAWLTGAAIFLVFMSVTGVFWYGAEAVASGAMSAGALSQFVLYAVFAAGGLSQLTEVWNELSQAAGAAGRIAEILGEQPRVREAARPSPLPSPPAGAIVFEGVRFAYPARPETEALKDVSFSIAPGERVAIAGPSGAGKTTLIQLLLRFYDPSSGRITLDGVDIKSAPLADLRARIALVPQDPVIFSGSIAENIAYAKPGASRAEIEAAARQAAAHEFISALPQRYETLAGERGVTLSGGQRQRIAIARAILKDAPVLLLDEATSALDAENESQVQEALDRLMRGRTSLVIAHRLATIRGADRILLLDSGMIVEEGTHERLAAAGGLYARLAKLQFESEGER